MQIGSDNRRLAVADAASNALLLGRRSLDLLRPRGKGLPSAASLGALALALSFASAARAQQAAFELPDAGCPMAHCDSNLSDQTRAIAPSTANLIATDSTPVGGGGLGCVSNLRIVACSFRGDPQRQSNLVVYDADGRRIWEDGGILGWQAWMSAPIIGKDGSVIAADQYWVFRAQPATNTVLWRMAKPDPGTPISPVLVGEDRSMVMLATKDNLPGGAPAITVWDVETGTLLSHSPMRDPASGKLYITRNTPAVSGNRAYVLMSQLDDETDGRLYAIDVCDRPDCGGRGALSVRWTFGFKGPSGASPLLIGSTLYFDGRPTSRTGSLMAVEDRGGSGRRLWLRRFHSTFGVSPAHDPRGGLWVHYVAPDGLSLMRLNEADGSLLQEISASAVLGVDPGYVAHSVMMLARTSSDGVVMLFGAQPGGTSALPTYVAAVDVGATASGVLLWRRVVGANKDENAASGQFPIVASPSGSRRIVFEGSKRSTFFVGEP